MCDGKFTHEHKIRFFTGAMLDLMDFTYSLFYSHWFSKFSLVFLSTSWVFDSCLKKIKITHSLVIIVNPKLVQFNI